MDKSIGRNIGPSLRECGPLTEAEYERINAAFERLLLFEKSMSSDTKERFKYGRRMEEPKRLQNEVEQEEFWLRIQKAELDETWVAMPDQWSYPNNFDSLAAYALNDSLARMKMFNAFEKLLWQPGWSGRDGRIYAPLYWNGTVVEDVLVMTEGERNRMDSLARKDRVDFQLTIPLREDQNSSLPDKSLLRRQPSLPGHPIFSDLVDKGYDELFNELASWEAIGSKLRCPYTDGDLINLKKLPLPLLSENPNVRLAEWFISNRKKPLTAAGLGKTQCREGGKVYGIVQRALRLLDTSE